MKKNQTKHRILAALAVSALLTAGLASSAPAAPDVSNKTEHDWAAHRQERLTIKLAKAAEHLGIQPSQQGAWQAYADAIESSGGDFHKKQGAPTDAASMAHRRADFAAAHAAKLAKIADATTALQAVLTPEQRQKFDRFVQRAGHHGGWQHHHGDGSRPNGNQAVASPAPVAPANQ